MTYINFPFPFQLQSQCKILADEKQHLEAMVHKLKKEYEIVSNFFTFLFGIIHLTRTQNFPKN